MKRIESTGAPSPIGAYPHALRAGPFLFLSGIGPRDPDGGGIPGNVTGPDGRVTSYDFERQCRATFGNVRAVLEASGARWDQLVDVTVFLTDMRRDFETFNAIYAEYFERHQPCRTTVEVSSLPTPIAIELKCLAWLG